MEIFISSCTLLNVGMLAAVFMRLGEVHQRMKGVEWRLLRLEDRHEYYLREGQHA